MKNRIFAIVLIFCFTAVSAVVAQEQRRVPPKREHLSTEEMARRKSERMAKELQLDAQQIEAVYEVNLNQMKLRQAQQQEKKKIHQNEAAEMKKILSEDQYKQWMELRRPARPMESRRPRTVSQEKGKSADKSNESRLKMEKE